MMNPDEGRDSVTDPADPDDTDIQRDELDIIANQDETDPGEVDEDDALMGAGPTDELSSVGEPGDFARGEVDVKEQMDRAGRMAEYPNRAVHGQHNS